MPIYEYKCVDCGEHLEVRQKISDAPLEICDECGGKLEKQWSLAGFKFKGAGWYVTDYADKKTDSAGSETPAKPGKTEKTAAGKSTESPKSASNQASDSSAGGKPDAAPKK